MKTLSKAIKLALYGSLTLPVSVFAEELEPIEVKAKAESTEESGRYTVSSTTASTGLALAPKEIPQSVSVVTSQQMKDQHLTTLSRALETVTGVSVTPIDDMRNSFSARGFSIDKYQIDGMQVSRDSQWAALETTASNVIYDRIEVVRGATGLMTGAGEPSAGVNLVRKHADSKTPYTILEAGVANKGYLSGMLDHQRPLNSDGTVRGRVVAHYQGGKNFIDEQKNRQTTLYAVVDADLADNTGLSIGVSYEQLDKDSPMWGGLPLYFSNGSTMNWARSKTTSTDWSYWDSKATNFFAELDHRINDKWKLRVKANQRLAESKSKLFYFSGTAAGNWVPYIDAWGPSPGKFAVDSKQTDVGIDVDGKFSAWGLEHDLMIGAAYSRVHRQATAADIVSMAPAPDFLHWDGSYPEPVWGAESTRFSQKIIEKAVYASTRLKATENLSVILGGRLSAWESNGVYYGASRDYKTNSAWTPYIGLVYALTDNQSIYASYTDIFKPQNNFDRDGKVLDPVTGKSYEAGWKGSFLNNSLETQFSVFRTEQDNLAQSLDEYIPGTTITAYRAVDGAVVKGFEAEVSGNVTPELKLTAGYSQWKGHDNTRAPLNTDHPNKQFKLFAAYNMDSLVKGLTVGGGVNWQNRSYAESALGKNLQGSYALVNLMARYQFTDHFSAQLNIDNLFDKKYRQALSRYQYNYGEPLYANLTLRYEF